MSYFLETSKTHLSLFIEQGGEHKRYTLRKWRAAVRKGATLGYAAWVANQVLAEFLPPAAPAYPAPAAPYPPAPVA